MANKYLTIFDSIQTYNGRIGMLDKPNVSLISEDGSVLYAPLKAGETFGDILLYDEAEDAYVTTKGGKITDDMLSLKPIAILVVPPLSSPDGFPRYLSLAYMSTDTPQEGAESADLNNLEWGPDSTTAGQWTSTDLGNWNGLYNLAKVVKAINDDSELQGQFPPFENVAQFDAMTTLSGNFYIPATKELTIYRENIEKFHQQVDLVNEKFGTNYDPAIYNIWTSTEWETDKAYAAGSDGASFTPARTNDGMAARAMVKYVDKRNLEIDINGTGVYDAYRYEEVPYRKFMNWTGLTSVYLFTQFGDSPVSVGEQAFRGSDIGNFDSSNATELQTIGTEAFLDCTGLTAIHLGSNLAEIGDRAFKNCTALEVINSYAATAPTLGTDAFLNIASDGELHTPNGSDYSSWASALPVNWTIIDDL